MKIKWNNVCQFHTEQSSMHPELQRKEDYELLSFWFRSLKISYSIWDACGRGLPQTCTTTQSIQLSDASACWHFYERVEWKRDIKAHWRVWAPCQTAKAHKQSDYQVCPGVHESSGNGGRIVAGGCDDNGFDIFCPRTPHQTQVSGTSNLFLTPMRSTPTVARAP